ncbi:MAG TPA: helix-turn-helix domain-containing protein, partial [Trebonia sp.]|nr:helix-turn-helix domain-containing protein [Trebonia sp.]
MEPAPRQPRERAAGSWQWARTAGTQRALLDAAREVFVEQGFANASIAEVVQRASSSVGSLYHHFGGKSELFIALWQEHQAAHDEAASTAVAKAKRAGVTDSFELFSVGARAYLEGSWQRRDLAILFFNGDSPPG